MRNGKKWLSVTAAVCMVVPSMTAFAAGPATTATLTGQGSIEYDSKEVAPYYHVELPTVTNSTYDFILDPMKTLQEYDKTSYTAPAAEDKTAFFTTTKTPSTIVPVSTATAGTKVYTYKYTEVSAANVKTALDTLLTGGAVAAPAAGATAYYVWIPDKTNAPNGSWVKLDETNVLDYCIPCDSNGDEMPAPAGGTYSGIDHLELNPDCKKDGEEIFDGKLYELKEDELVAGKYNVSDYVEVDATGAITGLKAGITGLATSSNGTAFTKIDATNLNTLEIKEAEILRTNISDKATIVNKSSANTKVDVEVTVVNPDGLTFLAAAPANTDLGANVFVQIKGAQGNQSDASLTDETPKVLAADADGNVTNTLTVTLPGLSDIDDYVAYQGDVIPETQGHEIVRYNQPEMDYKMAEFCIEVAANEVTSTNIADPDDLKAAEEAWGAYIDGLKDGTYTKPDIQVVYTLTNEINAPAETAITGSYGNDGSIWFALDSTGGFTDHDKLTAASVKQTDGSYTPVSTADLAKIEFDSSTNWAKVTWNNLVAIGHPSSEGNVEIKFTYDGADYVVTVTP